MVHYLKYIIYKYTNIYIYIHIFIIYNGIISNFFNVNIFDIFVNKKKKKKKK